MATTSRSESRSSSARRVLRPMRPKPLMAMRVMGFLSCSASMVRGLRPARQRRDRETASGGERAPVLRGRGAEDALEVQAQVRAGPETDACGDLLDAEV